MPAALKKSEVDSKTDPSVAKQYDTSASSTKKLEDLYKLTDDLSIGLLGTYRPDIGPVGRSMATAKRDGPDYYFLANGNSKKFSDIEASPAVALTFQNSTTQDWVSIAGTATVLSEEKDIKGLWREDVKAWFGDLGDGTHDGGPTDPRMKGIKITPTYAVYWIHGVGKEGFEKEVNEAKETGKVAQTGTLRELTKEELDGGRK